MPAGGCGIRPPRFPACQLRPVWPVPKHRLARGLIAQGAKPPTLQSLDLAAGSPAPVPESLPLIRDSTPVFVSLTSHSPSPVTSQGRAGQGAGGPNKRVRNRNCQTPDTAQSSQPTPESTRPLGGLAEWPAPRTSVGTAHSFANCPQGVVRTDVDPSIRHRRAGRRNFLKGVGRDHLELPTGTHHRGGSIASQQIEVSPRQHR